MARSRTRPPRPVLPVASALLLSTITLLSACSSSAEIESDQQADPGNAVTRALTFETSPGPTDRATTDEDAAALVSAAIAEDRELTPPRGRAGAGARGPWSAR